MRFEFANASAMPPGFWKWPHISPTKEWADHSSGRLIVETEFLDRFEQLRAVCGFPLIINSGYRTPAHNRAVSTTGDDGPHTTGRACDIRIYGERALKVIAAAYQLGFTGIGASQKGEMSKRFIHVDDLLAPAYPRPTIWTY